MTNQEINEAIALACGWRYAPRELIVSGISIGDDMPWIQPDGTRRRVYNLPNYCNDLNAMHEAWKSLTKEQHQQFKQHLANIVLRDGHIVGPCRSLSNATARQRAEAFLRTIGKWKEESK
jgi:hypothetical protein